MYQRIIFKSGGICGLIYHMGVANRLERLREQRSDAFDWKSLRVYGISAGGAVGLLWLCNVPPREYKRLFYELVDASADVLDHSSWITRVQLSMCEYVRCTYPRRLRRVVRAKRLYIGLSTSDGFRFTNKYSTVAEMLHLVMCGASIPLVCSYPSFWRGAFVCDGGWLYDRRSQETYGLLSDTTLEIVPPAPFPLSLYIPPPVVFDWLWGWSDRWLERLAMHQVEYNPAWHPDLSWRLMLFGVLRRVALSRQTSFYPSICET
jgi:hypothetical protein